MLDQIRLLNQRTLRILAEAEHGKWKNPSVALDAVRECRRNLELIGKLTGELKSPEANAHEPVKVIIEYVDKQLVVEHTSQPALPGSNET